MAQLYYNGSGYGMEDPTDQSLFGAGVHGGVQNPTEQDINDYYSWISQQRPNYAPPPVTDEWYAPYEYFTDQNTFRPTDDQGYDAPVDELMDWYYNNPDAQYYTDQYWNPPPPQTEQPPPPVGGDGGAQQPWTPPPSSNRPYAPNGPGWPALTTAEPLQMAEQDRIQAAAWGDYLDRDLFDSQGMYRDQEAAAREQAWSGPGGYSGILAGNGGFNPEQSANILQEEMLRNGMAGDAEYDANFLTPEERAAMAGNPYAARDMAAGKLTYLDQWLREGDAAQRAAVSALDADLNAAVDPSKLTLSDEYNANFQFGQGDADALAEQAARFTQASASARDQALRDAAFAHGNTSPLALAAAQAENRVQADIAANDSVSDARLKGRGLMLDVARNREMDRLNAERDLSGRQRDIASEIRQTQLNTEKGISDAWNDYGRYNTNLMVDTTGQAEAAASNRAGQLATNRQNANQANINTRFGQAGTASSALSGRYGTIYGQKKQEEAEGRGFLTGQQDRAQAGGQGAQSNRLNLYGQRMGATGAATSRAIQAKNLPTFIDKAAGFAGGLLGG